MRQFEFDGKTYNLCNSWEDMTLQRYINFFLFQDKMKDEPLDDVYVIELIELLSDCDVIMEVPLATIEGLFKDINFLTSTPKLNKGNTIMLDNKLYACVDLNNLSTGEYISIKMMMGDEKTILQGLPKLLAVIIRPAEKFIDEETKQERIKIEKFSIDNLSWRAAQFSKLRIVDVLHWTTFFLTGRKPSSKIIRPSTNQKVKKETHGHQ